MVDCWNLNVLLRKHMLHLSLKGDKLSIDGRQVVILYDFLKMRFYSQFLIFIETGDEFV